MFRKTFGNYKLILALIPILSLAMHYQVMRLELTGFHVWRQTQTQTIVKNFYSDDFNILNPKLNDRPDSDRILRLEFPVMQWLFALADKIFGYDVLISRILSFIIGIFSVFGMFYLIKILFRDPLPAAIGAWAFNFSPAFYYYTVNPMPDNFALCCGIWSMVFFFRCLNHNRLISLIASGFFLGLAALSKLPFILYSSVIIAFLYINFRTQENASGKRLKAIICYGLLLLPALIWYSLVIPHWGEGGVVTGIMNASRHDYPVAELLWFNFISTLPELLVNYAAVPFFLAGFYFIVKEKIYKRESFPLFAAWGISLLAYFIFEINVIGKVHDYYLFPFLPLIFIIVAYGAWKLILLNSRTLKITILVLLLPLPFTAWLRSGGRWQESKGGINTDLYLYRDELRHLVPDNSPCIVGNDPSQSVFLYYIDKKGWIFSNDDLHARQVEQYISLGAQYLFTDSPVDTSGEIKKYIAKKIYEKASLRVYRLRSLK